MPIFRTYSAFKRQAYSESFPCTGIQLINFIFISHLYKQIPSFFLKIHLVIFCLKSLQLMMGRWSTLVDNQSTWKLNWLIDYKICSRLIVKKVFVHKLQTFNCLFHLILVEYEGNCAVLCYSSTFASRPPFS